MTSELLKKEKEFYKLNEELEIRTKELMQQVDVVMKLQDSLTKESAQSINQIPKYNCYSHNEYDMQLTHDVMLPRSKRNQFHIAAKGDCGTIPDSVNDMGVKGMTHFLRAKINKMQNDYDRLYAEHKTKGEELKKLQKENLKLSENKDKWFQISTGHKTQINKLDNQISALDSRIQSKENENASLKKDIDQLQKDLKNETLSVTNLELKLQKATKECEKYRLSIKNAKQEEKDLRESHRKQINEMTSIIKKIEKHKTEILNGFKKQLLLIDNLKKQKAHIEDYKITEKTENDFMKILDWNIQS